MDCARRHNYPKFHRDPCFWQWLCRKYIEFWYWIAKCILKSWIKLASLVKNIRITPTVSSLFWNSLLFHYWRRWSLLLHSELRAVVNRALSIVLKAMNLIYEVLYRALRLASSHTRWVQRTQEAARFPVSGWRLLLSLWSGLRDVQGGGMQ